MSGTLLRLSLLVATTLSFWATFPSPAPAGDFATGASPSSVAVDDFNRDGKLDLAVANNRSDTVSVLLGNGDGTFQAAVSYPVGSCSHPPDQRSFPWSVAVGDFDGDGKLDLAVANSGCHTVSVLWGNGDGTFQTARDFGAGISPVFVTTGDFNRDGKLDLVVANLFSGVSVLLGNGVDRTFQAAVSYSTGTQSWSVEVGDFNGDLVPDLAVANFDANNVSILRGIGDGTFQAAGTYAAGRQPRSVAVADFNGDGTSDLAVANFDTFNSDTNDVSVLLGKGDGTFPAPLNTPAGTGALSWVHSISVATGDFNGDGKLDLAVANQDTSVSVLLSNGDGTFRVAGTFA